MPSFEFVQTQKTALAGSGISASDTSILLRSFKLPDGTNIIMSMFGDTGKATIEPGTEREENIVFTGITQNANGTALLTGVTRGHRLVAPYDSDSSRAFSHPGGRPLVISNNASFYNDLKEMIEDIAISGSPNASESQKGIVEEATDTEIASNTGTGATGAKLFVPADSTYIQRVVK